MNVAVVVRVVGVASALLSGCAEGKDDRGSESGASQGSESDDDDDSTSDASTGATANGSSDTGAGAQPDVCTQMFDCLADVAPEVAAPLLELYGEAGSCWQLSPGEQAICEAACEGQLQNVFDSGLWDQQVCGGVFQPDPAGANGPEGGGGD
jgi:hypothetical protein